MCNVRSRFLEIVWPYCANTVDVLVSRRYEFPRTLQVFVDIQKFLVLFCRNESPRTLVHLCIFLSHFRTRRYVSPIWFSRCGFPCTPPILLTGALSVPRLFDAIGLCTVEELVAACETRFNVGFNFATILASPSYGDES